MKYNIKIQEILERYLVVEAPNDEEAIDMITEKYKNEEIVLDYNDLVDALIVYEGTEKSNCKPDFEFYGEDS